MALQNQEMRGRGIGWKAEACRDPRSCDDGLCVEDWAKRAWHPEDPLAFAKWRVRASLDDIPSHVLVKKRAVATVFRDVLLGRAVVVGAVGFATVAGVLAVWAGRHGRGEPGFPVLS
jgi:hypothetical protein